MDDREKVIKGMEICTTATESVRCPECPYKPLGGLCKLAMMRDALALLKAQEQYRTQKKSKRYNDMDWSGAQGNDGERIKEQAARSEWGIYG